MLNYTEAAKFRVALRAGDARNRTPNDVTPIIDPTSGKVL